jgi:hypothetical protein
MLSSTGSTGSTLEELIWNCGRELLAARTVPSPEKGALWPRVQSKGFAQATPHSL